MEADQEKRLCMIYLANDVLQNSRRKGPEFVREFYKVRAALGFGLHQECVRGVRVKYMRIGSMSCGPSFGKQR